MTSHAQAFSPGHISGYFKRISGPTPQLTGSVGAGIVISEGVTAYAERAKVPHVIIQRVNREGTVIERTSGSPPLEYAMDDLQLKARITTSCRLPVGAGFGMSAAALLASLTALNRIFSLGMTTEEIAVHAHVAEVVHRTGLGDVAACQGGGFVVRKGPGIHAEIVRQIPEECPLCAVSFGPIPTSSVLGSPEQMARVAAAFPDESPTSVSALFRISRTFAEKSGLVTPEVARVLKKCDKRNIPATMTLLGNGVFAYGTAAGNVLASFGDVHRFTIARHGVHLLEECG
jgi:pantoate kinase